MFYFIFYFYSETYASFKKKNLDLNLDSEQKIPLFKHFNCRLCIYEVLNKIIYSYNKCLHLNNTRPT